MAHYVALIHKEPDSCYGVSFPDFPGCISAGDSADEALTNAIEALRSHVELMVADGDAIPSPRSIEEIRRDPEFVEDLAGAVMAYVPLLAETGRKVRVNVSFDEVLLSAFDEEARRRGMNRSSFLAEAGRRFASGFDPDKQEADSMSARGLKQPARGVRTRRSSKPTPKATA